MIEPITNGMTVVPDEQTIRLAFFLGTLIVVAFWEFIAPRRVLNDSKARRWFTNLSLVLLDTVAIRLLLPILPVGVAATAQVHGWGILNNVTLPIWLKIILAVLILDCVIYLQHLLFHFLPTLWRLHRMHHTDLDIDVTTGNRFHPIEIVISFGIKMAAVTLIGPPVAAVIVFEVVLNATSQFNHGNIRIAETVDRWLRLVVVTPDMHRVHHSVIPRETNSNFGFNFPWWDRLFGTYRPQPELGHIGMSIGLKEYRDPAQLTLLRLLVQPFMRS
ncbi:C-5 sterol desaturase [Geobacter sp. OR-1]|uniref:sterol desaturase family protein n=1 Tax=Geobacter sp. OR-1 TaxID=1266765 RepID=UPI000541A67C|nr:sterol desaturase family protein [Geobacter sp. OR-1]GAM08258.1 C-5 sterol desaturase [Geobacter sp. OR-1]